MDKTSIGIILTVALTFPFLVFSQKQETKTTPTPVVEQQKQEMPKPEEQKKPEEQPKEELVNIKGTVKEIAKDKSYIIVDDTKILTTKEFLDESYLEVGDKVEIAAQKVADGLKAVNYNYIFEEEAETQENTSD